jgi:hypothetical protein
MDDSTLDSIERQLANSPVANAPAELRHLVLTNVRDQLKTQRWDRRLGRAAIVLVIVGIALNATAGWRSSAPPVKSSFVESRPDAITRTAVFLAEATDAETAREFARHLAALSGRTLSPQQEAAIQRQIETVSKTAIGHAKDG